MSPKEKIRLTAAQETLLITLYAKATLGQRILADDKAQEMLGQIEYDFARLRVKRGTALTVAIRAKKMDAYTREFLACHPNSLVVHLGCGLDARYVRVDDGRVEWYDLDVPEVIELRRKFFEETDRYHLIPSSVTDWDWIDQIPAQDRAVLVVAEGLLMYLGEHAVKTLLLRLREFPGCELVFDAYSTFTARHVKWNPSLKKTGAVVQWGIDDARLIETWAEGIRLKEEWTFFQSEDIGRLGWADRLLFRLVGLFQAGRKAHRILYFTL